VTLSFVYYLTKLFGEIFSNAELLSLKKDILKIMLKDALQEQLIGVEYQENILKEEMLKLVEFSTILFLNLHLS